MQIKLWNKIMLKVRDNLNTIKYIRIKNWVVNDMEILNINCEKNC